MESVRKACLPLPVSSTGACAGVGRCAVQEPEPGPALALELALDPEQELAPEQEPEQEQEPELPRCRSGLVLVPLWRCLRLRLLRPEAGPGLGIPLQHPRASCAILASLAHVQHWTGLARALRQTPRLSCLHECPVC